MDTAPLVISACWILAALCLTAFAWIAIYNWVCVINALFFGKYSSWGPFVGGGIGCAGFLLAPNEALNQLWWLPFLLDWGCLPGLTHTLLYFAVAHIWIKTIFPENSQFDSKYAKAYYRRGRAYWGLAHYDMAIADFTVAQKLNSKLIPDLVLADVYYGRGRDYLAHAKFDEAISDLTTAIQFNQKYTKAYHKRGLAYVKKHELDKAIADLSVAIQLDPKYAVAYYDRGLVYEMKNDHWQAETDFSMANKIGFTRK